MAFQFEFYFLRRCERVSRFPRRTPPCSSRLERRSRLPLTHAQHTWTAITMAEVAEIKLFGKWTYEDVEVRTRSRPRAGRLTAGKSSSLSRVLASHAPAPSNQPLTATPFSPHRSTTSLSRFVNTPQNIARARRATPPVAARADARDRPDPAPAYTLWKRRFFRAPSRRARGVPAASNARELRGRDECRAECHAKPRERGVS